MTTKIKFKKIDPNFVKKNYPVLYETLKTINIETDSDTFKQVAGLCIEIALRSDGTVDLFEDDLPDEFLKDDDDEF